MAVSGDPYTDTMLRKELYVIFTKPVAPREDIRKILPEHLKMQVELEKKGILFAAGPMDPFDETKTRTGMIIVRAKSFEEANEIAKNDPMHSSGAREYEIWRWSMNEGSYTVTINYSDQSAMIG
tara:strand:+ start:726 stop:1097 length:372 start_codon:yes stop_codon:yes gene_type:complete